MDILKKQIFIVLVGIHFSFPFFLKFTNFKGIVLWELATKQEPYQGLNPPDIILGVTKQFLRPPIPQDCHPLYVELMKDCWAQEASTRPSFIEILQRLELLDPEKNKDDFNENSRMEEISDVTPMNLTTQFQTVKAFRPMKWQIDPTQLKFLEDFREASNANFYKGIYNNNPVIIKVLKEPQEPNENFDEKEFQIELDILRFENLFINSKCSPLFSFSLVLFEVIILHIFLDIAKNPNMLLSLKVNQIFMKYWNLI